jgi:hypothetical protein
MISARENNTILLKFGRGEDINVLQNVLESYNVKSGYLEGFGEIESIESEKGVSAAGEVILYGIISNLKGKPYLELYCYSEKTSKLKNFFAKNLIIIIKKFDEIKLNSILDEEGKMKLSIEEN